MRTLLICALGALALAACQKPAEDPATDETAAAADAAAMEAAAAAEQSATSGSTAAGEEATAADDAAVETSGTASAHEGMAMPSATTSGVSQATRDAAKEKAEQTNLHP